MNQPQCTVEEHLDQQRWEQEFTHQKRGETCSHWAPIDTNVEEVRKLLQTRMITGLKKYGVTTERKDLSTQEWLQHAIEEALDLAVYLTKLKKELK